MTEQTDKASQKSGKAAPKGRSGKSRSPKSKRAKAPGDRAAAEDQASRPQAATAKGNGAATQPEARSLAPDPATITFGSNRPIVAAPHKLPEGSGLRFSGPSLGELKASGPQPTSAKASGLTFTSAKGSGAKGSGAKGSGAQGGNGAKPNGAKANGSKPSAAKPNGAARPEPRKAEARKADPRKPDAAGGKAGTDGKDKKAEASASQVPAGGGKHAPLTKPAIAPQQSGRRLERERSSSGFALTLLGLVVVVGGLAFWFNRGDDAARPDDQLAAAPAAAPQAPAAAPAGSAPGPEAGTEAETATTTEPAAAPEIPTLGPSPRAPVSPGPLVATNPGNLAGVTSDLDPAEIGEIQQMLDVLGLAPGNLDGVLTADTAAAIRAYQEMAGLPADGAADRALLEELRSVIELYGS